MEPSLQPGQHALRQVASALQNHTLFPVCATRPSPASRVEVRPQTATTNADREHNTARCR
ncbi:hypothetical protein IEO21_11230 [Rhodonia placenta]|uniref:Uncharacterized protein n=1 Tax=Rhodonia placenta TaxID=104341 RepID=A0A8H7NR49_9APHY|nr:hypothetical protein IEO21_11230 [Postia placenta]